MTELRLEGGKTLRVYDDLFPLSFRLAAFQFATQSHFNLGWNDGIRDTQSKHKYIHAVFSLEDVARLGIMEYIKLSPAAAELHGHQLAKAVLNLSTPTDVHFAQTHAEDKILLYYVNAEWQDGWHGETLFYNETCREIVYASVYTPGRLISFDGSIPHAIRPQSIEGPRHRFTLALIFNKTDL